MNDRPDTTSPSPLLAAALSCLCPGLGQLACGRRVRGAAFLGGSLLFAPCVLAVSWVFPLTRASLVVLIVAAGSYALVSLAAVLDALRLGGRATPGGSPPLRLGLAALGVVAGLAYPAVAVDLLRDGVLRAYHVPTASMAPAVLPGDRLLADVRPVSAASLRRGDLVVFSRPGDPSTTLVKRVVGLPGEDVRLRDGVLRIDGRLLTRGYASPTPTGALGPHVPLAADTERVWECDGDAAWPVLAAPSKRPATTARWTLRDDEVLLLGDHRDNAVDSRQFGPVPLDAIAGVVRYLFWGDDLEARFGPVPTVRDTARWPAGLVEEARRARER